MFPFYRVMNLGFSFMESVVAEKFIWDLFNNQKVLTFVFRYEDKFLLVIFPFHFSLWLGIICTILLLTIILSYASLENKYILEKKHETRLMRQKNKIKHTNKKRLKDKKYNNRNQSWIKSDYQIKINIKRFKKLFTIIFKNFSTSFFIIYYFTLIQPLPRNLQGKTKFSLRFIFALSLMQTLLISTAYISGLSAILTVPRFEHSIKTLQDLIDSKMEWGADDVSWVIPIMNSNDVRIANFMLDLKIS